MDLVSSRRSACPGDPDTYCEPTDWLGDRLFVTVRTARGADIWSVAADKSHAAEPLLAEPYSELGRACIARRPLDRVRLR